MRPECKALCSVAMSERTEDSVAGSCKMPTFNKTCRAANASEVDRWLTLWVRNYDVSVINDAIWRVVQ
jgi:hypothetical protein